MAVSPHSPSLARTPGPELTARPALHIALALFAAAFLIPTGSVQAQATIPCASDFDCNDGSVCTDDFCDLVTQTCAFLELNSTCDDGNACTTGDFCTARVCVGGDLAGGCASCAGAAVIPDAGGSFVGTTAGASSLDGSCNGSSISPERVYQWTPLSSGTAVVDTCAAPTDYDTVVYLRQGDCASGGEVACNDNTTGCAPGDVGSQITVSVVGGQTYYIVVDGAGGQAGTFRLTVSPPQACGNGIAEPGEQCDGSDDFDCASGQCDGSCSCVPLGGGQVDLIGGVSDVTVALDTSVDPLDVVEGCATQSSGIDLVRFKTDTLNIGTADLVLGNPGCPDCDDPANTGVPCQNPHYRCASANGQATAHYQNFAFYDVLDMNGQVMMSRGNKKGFCVRDSFCDPGVSAVYTCGNQGIRAGCGDRYSTGTGCNYVDVTNVPDGDYLLRVRVDPYDLIPELDESNNTLLFPITIPRREGQGGSTPIEGPGGTFNGLTSGTSISSASCELSTANSPEQVFEWLPDVTGTGFAETCSVVATQFDTVLYARDGALSGPEVACNDDTVGCAVDDGTADAGLHGSRVSFPIQAGVPVYLFVDGAGDQGPFQLNVAPVEAASIPPQGGVVTGVTSGPSGFSGSCKGVTQDNPEGVHEWIPDVSGTVRVETCSATNTLFDTILYVREASVFGAEIACDDDERDCAVNDGSSNAWKHGSVAEFPVTAGEKYYLFVDGWTAGQYQLTVTPAQATCGDSVAEGSEECDGSDDAACPGLCLSDCTCDVTGTDTVVLSPSRDTTLFESSNGSDLGNGAGAYLFAGFNAAAERRRGLIGFDIAGSIPAGSQIHTVSLDLHLSRTIAAVENVSLHPGTSDWGEGAADAPGEEGGGQTAENGDATWDFTFYDAADPPASPTWGTPGGDYFATPSAVTAVDDLGPYSWSSATMVADVQGWLDSPSSNFGWALLGNEGAQVTAKRFDSRENSLPSNRPRLQVFFTPPLTSGACCAADGMCTRVDGVGSCGGTYQGDGAACSPNPCPQPTGACCMPDASCSEAMTESDCSLQGGALQGTGSTCAQAQCAGPPQTVPTDIKMPGTQPEDAHDGLLSPSQCSQCHAQFPEQDWGGSMMAHAGRDPVFWAALAVAEQDFEGAGDLCLRCHTPKGWLAGRSLPTDGSALIDTLPNGDGDGVSCDFCHRLTNPALTDPAGPQPTGVQNAPFIANDGGTPAEPFTGSGMYVITEISSKLGPYADATAPHTFTQSELHRSSQLCGTCHDVSNPLVGDLAHNNGAQVPLAPGSFSGTPGGPARDKAAFNAFPYQYGVVERTFSEHVASLLSTTRVDQYTTLPPELQAGAIEAAYLAADPLDPNYEDGTTRVFSCQSCHMRATVGRGCNQNPPLRGDLPQHDLTGGNYWALDAIQYLDGLGRLQLGNGLTAQQISDMDAGKARARQTLEDAASLTVTGNELRIVNLTGHKLLTGYPEGRRMWVEVQWFDSGNAPLATDGAYGPMTVDIDGSPEVVDSLLDLSDPYTKVYEVHNAITQEWATELLGLGTPASLPIAFDRETGAVTLTLGQLVGMAPGSYHESFHFVLNNKMAKNNHIPPYGMSYDAALERNLVPVPSNQYGDPGPGGSYEHWDDFTLNPPPGADHANIRLLYQPTSWEYIQFLYLANDGANAFLANEGADLLEAWLATGMAAPHAMAATTWTNTLAACADGLDNDLDGLTDASDPGCSDAGDESENSFCDTRSGAPPACDNGIFCDGVETCDPVLGCLPGTPPSCDDAVACTIDSCNVTSDACDNIDDGTCPFCGDGTHDPGEECDGADDTACPGLCQGDCTCAPPGPVCGDDVVEGSEACDGSDDAACPGLCQPDCTCAIPGVTVIPAAGGVVAGNTTGAGNEYEGSCTGSTRRTEEAELQWTAATAGPVTVQTCGLNTSFDTVLYMRTDSIDGPEGGCNDDTSGCAVNDGASSHGSSLTFPAEIGRTYFFFVDGYGETGPFELTLTPTGGAFCGDDVTEGTEQCDGSDDAACPGECLANCSCPAPPVCGNDVVEGSEACDGTDDAACPGLCQGDCTCAPPPVCGNNVVEGSETCDGSDDLVCPGACQGDCSCPPPPPVCGNNVVEGSEACDGSDDAACPGLCQGDCTCAPPPVCGNNVVEGSETCDGSDDLACPGLCQGDCSCPPPPPVCGNNVVEGSETCDGSDDAACPGACQGDCSCPPPPVCGNNLVEGSETCDGTDDAACPGACQGDCSCPPPPVCGNDVVEGSETCDGIDDAACPGACQGDCSCPPPPVCGNDVVEGSEVCDGADAAACPGLCQGDCTCPVPVCGNDVVEAGEVCDGADASACVSGSCYAAGAPEGECTCVPGADPVLEGGTTADMAPNGSAFPIPYPAGVQAGDELLIWVGTDGDPRNLACTNFERLTVQREDGGTTQLGVFRRTATGPHTGFETCSWDSGESQSGGLIMTRVSNAARLRPPLGAYDFGSASDPAGIPIPVANALVLTACVLDGTGDNRSDPPVGYDQEFDGVGANSSGANISLASKLVTSSGVEDPGPFTNWSRSDGSACITLGYDNGTGVEPVFAHNFDATSGHCELEGASNILTAPDCDCAGGVCDMPQGGQSMYLPSATSGQNQQVLFRERHQAIPASGCMVMDFELNWAVLGTGNSTFFDFFNGNSNSGPNLRYQVNGQLVGIRCDANDDLDTTFVPTPGTDYKVRIEYCFDSGPGNCPGNPPGCADCGCLYVDTTADYGTTAVDHCDDAGSPDPIDGWSTTPGDDNLDLVWDDVGVCATVPPPGEKCGD